MLSFPKESLCVRRNEITKINKLFCECYQISPAPADRPLNKYPLLIKAMADECDRFLNIEKNNLSERADLIGPHMRVCGNQSLGSDKCVVRWAQLAVSCQLCPTPRTWQPSQAAFLSSRSHSRVIGM